MKKWLLVILLLSFPFYGAMCQTEPVKHGNIDPVQSSKNVNGTQADLLGQLADKIDQGDKKGAKAISKTIDKAGDVALVSGLQWLILAAVIAIGVGAVLIESGLKGIGFSIIVGAGAVVASSLIFTALIPYKGYLAWALIIAIFGGVLIHYRRLLKFNTGKVSLTSLKTDVSKVEASVKTDIKTDAPSVESIIKADIKKV